MAPSLFSAALALALLGAGAPSLAQNAVPPPPDIRRLPPLPAPAKPAPAAVAASAASAPHTAASGARPDVRVIEDDNVRIEETRVRGQTQRITVQNKVGPAKGYEIIVPPGGKDTSQDRGAAGQRAWSLFNF